MVEDTSTALAAMLITSSPALTPTIAVINGSSAGSARPNTISSTTNATARPMTSPNPSPLEWVVTTPPEYSTSSPARRAGPATLARAAFVLFEILSTGTENCRSANPIRRSLESWKL